MIKVLFKTSFNRKQILIWGVIQLIIILGIQAYYASPQSIIQHWNYDFIVNDSPNILVILREILLYFSFIFTFDVTIRTTIYPLLNRLSSYLSWLNSQLVTIVFGSFCYWTLWGILAFCIYLVNFASQLNLLINQLGTLTIAWIIHILSTIVLYNLFLIIVSIFQNKNIAYTTTISIAGLIIIGLSSNSWTVNLFSIGQSALQQNLSFEMIIILIISCILKIALFQTIRWYLFYKLGGSAT